MDELSPETLRMMERIIIAIGGIISIVLGYRLFRLVPTNNASGGALKSALLTISLSKVGPGVFFAAFGAFILVYGITTQITDRSEAAAPNISLDLARPVFNLMVARVEKIKDEQDKKELQEIILAIRQLVAVGTPAPLSHVRILTESPDGFTR